MGVLNFIINEIFNQGAIFLALIALYWFDSSEKIIF